MNKIFLLTLLLVSGLGSTPVRGQTLSQAKEWYSQGEYEKAKPVFQRLLKSSPNNGNYNLWYGVCCLKTGDIDQAVKPLEVAVKRRVPSGQLYLGQAYNGTYRYEEAVSTLEAYISDLTKRKRPTAEADSLLNQSRIGLRLLRGVEDVRVIDSFVVDKQQLLQAYRLGPESGKLFTYRDYFDTADAQAAGTVFETELGNRIYYSQLQSDSTLSILSSSKLLDQWSPGKPLPDKINQPDANSSYPFMLADGVTLYYASDGPSSLGGYDIFVTRYNTNTDDYLTPDNIGMPFNSPYNDYLYALDEINRLGWFASDRYQPEGKVCIYLFVPNDSKRVYNYETTEREKLTRLARLCAIKDTWGADSTEVAAARKRLHEVLSYQPAAARKQGDFEFVVDDRHVYHTLSDFHSPQAKTRYQQYRQAEQNYRQQSRKLDGLRQQYAAGNDEQRRQLSPAILDLEKRLRQLSAELKQAAADTRRLEQQSR